ncbi:MAG: DEAD/DEAH box helicase, partial [Pseudomonadota bacterium]
MRPPLLNPLYADVKTLNGVGPKLAATLSVLLRNARGDARLLDLVFHMPERLIDRRNRPEIARAAEGTLCTIEIRIDRHEKPANPRQPYRVMGHDETGELVLTFFRGQSGWLGKQLPVGETRFVSGKVEWFNGRPTMVHPDYIVSEEDFDTLPLVEPVYPLTAGLSLKLLTKAIRTAIDALPELPEWQDPSIVKRERWPAFADALHCIHHPRDDLDISADSISWRRLAYDELLAGQVALALVRKRMKRSAGKAWVGDGGKRRVILDALPFALTGAQDRSVREIIGDMEQPERMLRMLQGDVGSGKTAVALLCAAAACEAGGQAAIMAPTEVLARQHLATMAPLAETAGMRVEVFTGREQGATRAALLEDLAAGKIDVLVGTHEIE